MGSVNVPPFCVGVNRITKTHQTSKTHDEMASVNVPFSVWLNRITKTHQTSKTHDEMASVNVPPFCVWRHRVEIF